jgi:hypothetical protein
MELHQDLMAGCSSADQQIGQPRRNEGFADTWRSLQDEVLPIRKRLNPLFQLWPWPKQFLLGMFDRVRDAFISSLCIDLLVRDRLFRRRQAS